MNPLMCWMRMLCGVIAWLLMVPDCQAESLKAAAAARVVAQLLEANADPRTW